MFSTTRVCSGKGIFREGIRARKMSRKNVRGIAGMGNIPENNMIPWLTY